MHLRSLLHKVHEKSWPELARIAGDLIVAAWRPIEETVRFRWASGAFQRGRGCPSLNRDAEALRARLRQAGRPAFLFDQPGLERIIESLRQEHVEEVNEIFAQAGRLLAGDFHDFCPLATEPQLPFPRWHHDLTNGADWPLAWQRGIDYSSGNRPGEIRHLWDLHRQLFLPRLALAYRLSGERKYLDQLMALYYDWWHGNPLGRGLAWIGPQIQEHALRNVQWIACLHLLLDDEDTPASFIADLLQGIELQTGVLDWYYREDKPVSHNHLVSESLGLWLPGLLYPELPGAARWRARGGAGLARALDLQFGPDGLHREWTTNYHCFVLESALLARCVCHANGDPLLDGLDERLALAARFAARAAQPDGSIPYLGDADDALVYLWSARPHQDRRRYAATLALLLDRPDLAAEAGRLPAESVWMVGTELCERWPGLLERAPEPEPLTIHPGLNALIRRDGKGDWLLFHGGPSRIEVSVGASHLHADRNSVLLWLDGQEILLDPGTWLYNGDGEARNRLRASLSHNTALIDGRDQCDLERGRFVVADLPETLPLLHAAGPPLLALGQTRSRAGRHLRHLAWGSRVLYLRDELEGPGQLAIASFITAPGAAERVRVLCLREDGSLHPVAPGRRTWAGGRSRRYGVMEEAIRLESIADLEDGRVALLRHLILPLDVALPEILDGGEGLALAWAEGILLEPHWRGPWRQRRLANESGRLVWVSEREAWTAEAAGGVPSALPAESDLCFTVDGQGHLKVKAGS